MSLADRFKKAQAAIEGKQQQAEDVAVEDAVKADIRKEMEIKAASSTLSTESSCDSNCVTEQIDDLAEDVIVKERKIATSHRISESILEELKVQARESGRSVTGYIEYAIRNQLKRDKKNIKCIYSEYNNK